jgi:hypothetical protein
MGRHYNGDVQGKWWFGVQSSHTPLRFGGYETHIDYTICDDDTFKNRMKRIEDDLGDRLPILEKFFKEEPYYNNEKLHKYMSKHIEGYELESVSQDVEDYADYCFGKEVQRHFKESGEDYCNVNSEL